MFLNFDRRTHQQNEHLHRLIEEKTWNEQFHAAQKCESYCATTQIAHSANILTLHLICSMVCSRVRCRSAATPSITSFSLISSCSTSSCTRSIPTRFSLERSGVCLGEWVSIRAVATSDKYNHFQVWLTSRRGPAWWLSGARSSSPGLYALCSGRLLSSQSHAPLHPASCLAPVSRIWCHGFSVLYNLKQTWYIMYEPIFNQ